MHSTEDVIDTPSKVYNSKKNALEWTEPERAYRIQILKANNSANKTLNRLISKNPRAVVMRMGYAMGVAAYSEGTDIARLSGSSINRTNSKRIRNENIAIFEAQKKAEAKNRAADYEYCQHLREIQSLRNVIDSKQKHRIELSKSLLKRGVPLHFFSQRSKGKCRDKITAFCRCNKVKAFLTLTFISGVEDGTGRSILNKFFTVLKRDYLTDKQPLITATVCERQENGNIHFHIVMNKFINIAKFNALWVLQQYNEGLRFYNYDEQYEIPIEEIRQRYTNTIEEKATGTMKEILNPLDVKKFRGINGLSHYLTKYVTKNSAPDGFKCRVWSSSRIVSKLFTKTIISRSTFSALASEKNSRVVKRTGEIVKHPGIKSQFFQLFYIENKEYFLPEMSELESVNRWICDGMKIDQLPLIDDDYILKFYSN